MKRREKNVILTIGILAALGTPIDCVAQILTQFRDNSFTFGVPFDETPTKDNFGIKFQVSIRSCNLLGLNDKDSELFVGYTQYSLWNFFGESSPFHDNIYSPGLYWRKPQDNGPLTLGIEHMSNGRPYFGNEVAHEGYDDYSRGMNYFLLEKTWLTTSGQWSLRLKAGISCGVGEYPRNEKLFTQDLFLYYLGYATVLYDNSWDKFSVHAELTPIFNKTIANAQARLTYRFAPNWPAATLVFDHGYECLCDCRPNNPGSNTVRLGVTFEMKRK